VLVCVDSSMVTWEQWFPSDQDLPAPKRRKRLQRGAVASVQARLERYRAYWKNLLKQQGWSVPQIDPVDGLVFPDATQSNRPSQAGDQAPPSAGVSNETLPKATGDDVPSAPPIPFIADAKHVESSTSNHIPAALGQKPDNGSSRRPTKATQPAVQTADVPSEESERGGEREDEADFFDLASQLRKSRKEGG
jgi:hypothetical protein